MVYGRACLLVQRLQKHERVSGSYEEKKHTPIKGACTVSILPISNREYARMLVPAPPWAKIRVCVDYVLEGWIASAIKTIPKQKCRFARPRPDRLCSAVI